MPHAYIKGSEFFLKAQTAVALLVPRIPDLYYCSCVISPYKLTLFILPRSSLIFSNNAASPVLPERCSIREKGQDCEMPPEFVISVKAKDTEYMVGVTCERHKKAFAEKLEVLQKEGKIPSGTISFDTLKPIGTNCIRIDPNDLIEL